MDLNYLCPLGASSHLPSIKPTKGPVDDGPFSYNVKHFLLCYFNNLDDQLQHFTECMFNI